MTRPELLIVALVYAAALIMGQRLTAVVIAEAQEFGFAVAAVAGALAAALLYHRRARQRAPRAVKLAAGATLAACAVGVGLVTQVLWQPMLRPAVALPVAAAASFALVFLTFPVVRRLRENSAIVGGGGGGGGGAGGAGGGEGAGGVSESQVLIAAIASLLVVAAAWALPAKARSNVFLVARTFPGLRIGLPDWRAAEENALFEFGSIKLIDPNNDQRFLAVRWVDSDPVQADEYIRAIVGGTGLQVRDRSGALIGPNAMSGRHEGTTFYLESPDRASRAAATVWNCPQDHRVFWIFSFLSGPRSGMLATHERIVAHANCHFGGGDRKAAAATQKVFPDFAAPPGFTKQAGPGAETGAGAGAGSLAFVGPKGEAITFDAAVTGRIALLDESVTPATMSDLLTRTGILDRLDAPPTPQTVGDLQGHARRVWSAVGTAPNRAPVQMELMMWHCDRRDKTFFARYASPAGHDPREGVDALLPAVCHRE